ncbi:hypothetical protein EUX98_g5179 [Antrodiella citrinella]|uniref:Uncharacterized protein n=1 Tax=Antrodiella citrinella TaxID=2447956 RepID=A0A4S4MS27_9APHY|nr:hypothetical protein EUX98_g5179 [Antrodiella citrinella]
MESGIDFGRSARRGRRLHHPSIYHPITGLKISIDDKKERPERKTFHDRSNRIIDMVKRSEPNGKQAIVCMIRASSIANPKNKTKFHASPGPLGDLMQSIDLPGILHNIAEVHQFRNKKLEGSMNTNKRAHLEERIRRAKAEIAREHLEQKRLQVLMQRPPAPTVIDYTTILGHGYEGLQ